MNELSLFTGAGGGVLGTTLLGWNHVGYVEIDDYCQRVLAQRIKDGVLNEAPIFGNIETFNRDGYAQSYKGLVDIVSGGFPCQPFSVAGQGKGKDDERNLWPQTIECIRLVRPRYVLLENVPGLLAHEYFGEILGSLAESGYDCRWRILSAAEVGAPHKRDRLWIVAHTKSAGVGRESKKLCEKDGRQGRPLPRQSQFPNKVGNGGRDKRESGESQVPELRDTGCKDDVADTERIGPQRSREHEQPLYPEASGDRQTGESVDAGWWATEPAVGRVAYGVAHRVDRLKAIGNGQVPAVVQAVWELLTLE